jgi:hypothetical protein
MSSTSPEVLDAEPGVALERAGRRREIARPFAAGDLVENMHAYQELCAALLTDEDYQDFSQREKVGNSWRTVKKRFKKKSAWRKLALAFDLDVEILEVVVDRDEAGNPIRARAKARATTPSGRHQDGDGYCSITESRFVHTDPEKQAQRRERAENDLPATATTRAKNRAISDLLGTGEVSAEEMTGGGSEQEAAGPQYGPEYDKNLLGKMTGAAVVQLAGGDEQRGKTLWRQIVGELGYMPTAAALALIKVSAFQLAFREEPPVVEFRDPLDEADEMAEGRFVE